MLRTVLILVCGVLLGALLGTASDARQRTTPGAELLWQPETWVPFSADVEHWERGGRLLTGRYLRGSDGSVRREWRAPDAAGPLKVTIQNFTTQQGFYGPADLSGPWHSEPLTLSDLSYRPKKWRRMSGLELYRHKLAFLKGQDGSFRATDGLTAWIYSNNEGTMRIMAPVLNFHPIVSLSADGRREVLRNIEIGPVDGAMFFPPRNAVVQPVQ